jgi:hypothetical protein
MPSLMHKAQEKGADGGSLRPGAKKLMFFGKRNGDTKKWRFQKVPLRHLLEGCKERVELIMIRLLSTQPQETNGIQQENKEVEARKFNYWQALKTEISNPFCSLRKP